MTKWAHMGLLFFRIQINLLGPGFRISFMPLFRLKEGGNSKKHFLWKNKYKYLRWVRTRGRSDRSPKSLPTALCGRKSAPSSLAYKRLRPFFPLKIPLRMRVPTPFKQCHNHIYLTELKIMFVRRQSRLRFPVFCFASLVISWWARIMLFKTFPKFEKK